jgi:opacity protein-like surface antigen
MAMKSVLYAAAAFGVLAVSAPAFAADVPVEQSYPAAQVGYYDWTGAYFGLHTGYSFGNVETTSTPTVGAYDTDYDFDFLLGGVTFGYNHQFDRFVIGGEIDASFTDAEESIDPDGAGGVTEFQSDLDWLATARLRVGYAFDNILVYATAGGAAGETDDQIDTGAGLLNERRSRKGWTAGAGFEWGISENWTAKGEYLYVDLGEETVSNNAPILIPGGVATSVDFEHVYHMGRVGVNYRF